MEQTKKETPAAAQDGLKRRELILSLLHGKTEPVSGTELAKALRVSRQVIVQDIALLRAQDHNILSTYRGYVYYESRPASENFVQVFAVCHDTADTLDELQCIVDCGGRVLDVSIEHELYGHIRADLLIANRMEAAAFAAQMEKSRDLPLKALTGGCHYHTVSASSLHNLACIEQALSERGYLLGSSASHPSDSTVKQKRKNQVIV